MIYYNSYNNSILFLHNLSIYKDMSEKHKVQDTLDKAGIERLWKGVSKTNVRDIEDLKSAGQLRKALTQKDIKKWLLNTRRNLKKKLVKS